MNDVMRRNKNGMTTRPTSPLGSLVDGVFQNTLSRIFDEDWNFDNQFANRQVPVNIRETDKSYEMEVVAPGIKKEEMHVNINRNTLNISFEHTDEDKQQNDEQGYLRQEYRRQSFSRSFNLDDTIDAEKIDAQYKDGVLHVTLPKKEGAQRITKNIEVK